MWCLVQLVSITMRVWCGQGLLVRPWPFSTLTPQVDMMTEVKILILQAIVAYDLLHASRSQHSDQKNHQRQYRGRMSMWNDLK